MPSFAVRTRGYLELLHPFPSAMTMLAVGLFAAVAAQGLPPWPALGWVLASAALSQVAIASLNDYCDQALDAATKPWKPLPAGLVPPRAALALGVAAAPLAVLCALPLHPPALAAAIVFTAAGLAYDLWLKGTRWSALPFVAAFPALPLWGWGAVLPFEPRLLEAYLLGAPLVVGIHLADTWPDLEADRAEGVHGLAHQLGARRTRWLMWTVFLSAPALLLILSLAPGHDRALLHATALLAAGLILAALAVSRAGAVRWRAAFGLLAAAAIVVGVGWLASL